MAVVPDESGGKNVASTATSARESIRATRGFVGIATPRDLSTLSARRAFLRAAPGAASASATAAIASTFDAASHASTRAEDRSPALRAASMAASHVAVSSAWSNADVSATTGAGSSVRTWALGALACAALAFAARASFAVNAGLAAATRGPPLALGGGAMIVTTLGAGLDGADGLAGGTTTAGFACCGAEGRAGGTTPRASGAFDASSEAPR